MSTITIVLIFVIIIIAFVLALLLVASNTASKGGGPTLFDMTMRGVGEEEPDDEAEAEEPAIEDSEEKAEDK